MEVLKYSKVLSGVEYYIAHLNIINSIFDVKLSSKEISVLSSFMSQEESIVQGDRFNSFIRKRVRVALSLSPGGLGNYLNTMVKKGFLIRNSITGNLTIQKYLFPSSAGQGYQFKIIHKSNEDGGI